MIPVGPVTTLNRSILVTERGMLGTGGDDFICGHCGHVMLEDFDPSTVRGNPVYQCGVCETTMTYHSPRVVVATGPHGENQPETSLAETHTHGSLGCLGVYGGMNENFVLVAGRSRWQADGV